MKLDLVLLALAIGGTAVGGRTVVAVGGTVAVPGLPLAVQLLQTGAGMLAGLPSKPKPDWTAIATFPALTGRVPRLVFKKPLAVLAVGAQPTAQKQPRGV